MKFEPSDTTKRIREAQKRNFEKYIKIDNVKCNKETAQKLQKEYIERFEFIFSEQFIPLLSCFSANEMRQKNKEKSKEAIYLTLEYIDKILALAPPKEAKEHKIYYEMFYTFCVRKSSEVDKATYALLKNKEQMRKKALTQKERQWVYKKIGWEYPKELQKRTPMELREWINNIMQDNLNRLFDIWIQIGECSQYHQDFTQEVTTKILERIKEPKNPNRYDKRIYSYIVQYLKHIAQKKLRLEN